MRCNNLFVTTDDHHTDKDISDAYETHEGGDVCPAVLHEWIWTISNHVCDVFVETLRTYGNQTVGKDSLK